MTIKRSVQMILTVGALCAGGLTASARDMTQAERAGMEAAAADFADATDAGDFARVINYMPERVFEVIAADAGVDRAELHDEMVKILKQTMATMTIESWGFDLTRAREEEQIGGEPYAVIPYNGIIRTSDGERVLIQSQNIFFLNEAGDWRVIQIESATRRDTMVRAYPSFAGIEAYPIEYTTLKP